MNAPRRRPQEDRARDDDPKDHAGRATAALADLLRPGADLGAVAGIIQQAMDAASKTVAEEHAARLLSASPAVIYSFKARDDFAPTFVSDNLDYQKLLRSTRRLMRLSDRNGSSSTLTSLKPTR